MKQLHLTFILIAAALALLLPACRVIGPAKTYTVEERLEQYGAVARSRLTPAFQVAGVGYPPKQLTLVGLKAERSLQLYAPDAGGVWRWVRNYPVLGASGHAGPKLREWDHQVPEGIYPIEWLNPNALRHLSMRIGYPNEFDRTQAAAEGRTNLGGDIMIHGNTGSIGCLAMGDVAAEDLFVLVADTGLTNVTVLLAPVDFREGKSVVTTNQMPAWTDELYTQIKARLAELPLAK